MNIYALIIICLAVPMGIAGIVVAIASRKVDKEHDESCLPESNSDCLSDYLKHNEEILKGK